MKNEKQLTNHPHHTYMQDYSLRLEETPVEPQEKKQQPEAKKQSLSTWHLPTLRPFQACLIACMMLIFMPIFFAGYISAQENILTLPIYSSQFSGYYSRHNYVFAFYIRPEYEKMAIEFKSQEALIKLRWGRGYESTIKPGVRYYEL